MQPRILPDEPSQVISPKIIKRFLAGVGMIIIIALTYFYFIPEYIHYYVPEELPLYTIRKVHHDDTLRIAFIGDSWADYHTILSGDTMMTNAAKRIYHKPIKTVTRGKKEPLAKKYTSLCIVARQKSIHTSQTAVPSHSLKTTLTIVSFLLASTMLPTSDQHHSTLKICS